MIRLILFLLFSATLLLISCSDSIDVSGTDTETIGGKIQGNLVDENGNPLSEANVILIPSDYKPHSTTASTIKITETDKQGNFIIDEILMGTYNIEFFDSSSLNRALVQEIIVSDSQENNGVTINLKDQKLLPTHKIEIALDAYNIEEGGVIYIPGSSIYQEIDSSIISSNEISLLSLPHNTDVDILYQVSSDSTPQEVIGNIQLNADSVIGPYDQWEKMVEIKLNLQSLGIQLSEPLYNYPLLLRLDAEDFNKISLNSDGLDLRFSKLDLSSVPFEIESWNQFEKTATFWILIDTLHTSNSQSLLLHWGNEAAKTGEDSKKVFPTSNGFLSVWHLNEVGNSKPSNYQNSTQPNFHGTGYGIDGKSRVSGVISNGQYLDGINDYIEIPESRSGGFNFSQDGNYTISAWVNPDSLDGSYHPIVHKGDHQYGLKLHRNNAWEFVEYQSDGRWHYTVAQAVQKSWSFITGVRMGEKSLLYIDGILADSSTDTLSDTTIQTGLRDTTHNVRIGSNSTYGVRLWRGLLDEIRISNISRNEQWIRFDYESQKPNQNFIEFIVKE